MQNLPFFNNLCFNCPNYVVKTVFCQAYNKNCVLVKDCNYYNETRWPNKYVNPAYPLGDKYVNPAYPLGPTDQENTKTAYATTTTPIDDNCRVSLEYEDGIPVLYGVFAKEDLKLEWKV